jgi:hypothetical protein
MTVYEKITYPRINLSKDYFDNSINVIDLAFNSKNISYEEYEDLKSTIWKRFWIGYVSIVCIGIITIIIQLILGLITQILSYIVPRKWNYLFSLYKWITQKSITYERDIAKVEYKVGYRNKLEYQKHIEYLNKIYQDSIHPIYTGYTDDFKVEN